MGASLTRRQGTTYKESISWLDDLSTISLSVTSYLVPSYDVILTATGYWLFNCRDLSFVSNEGYIYPNCADSCYSTLQGLHYGIQNFNLDICICAIRLYRTSYIRVTLPSHWRIFLPWMPTQPFPFLIAWLIPHTPNISKPDGLSREESHRLDIGWRDTMRGIPVICSLDDGGETSLTQQE